MEASTFGLTAAELRAVLPTRERNALVLLSRGNDRDWVAKQLGVSEFELSRIEEAARARIERAVARKRDRQAVASGAGATAGERKTPRAWREAQFRDELRERDLAQAEVGDRLGLARPESTRLKLKLVERGHVVETGELRGRSPVLHLTEAGRQAEPLRSEDGRAAATGNASGAGSTLPPVAADAGGEPQAAARPVSDHPEPAHAVVCPHCGGNLSVVELVRASGGDRASAYAA